MTRASCGCPQHDGRRITDPARHEAWHELVVAQGGPQGVVDVATLSSARGARPFRRCVARVGYDRCELEAGHDPRIPHTAD